MIFLSSILLIGISSTAYINAQGQLSGQFPQSIVVFSNTDPTPHSLELAAIQQGNAESSNVSGFSLDSTNTVTAQMNSQLVVFVTDNTVQVIGAKVRTATDQMIDLNPSTQANAFSIANLPAGVYTLDVITQKGDTKAAYEGILVIGQQPTNPQTIIERQVTEERDDGGDDRFIIIGDGDNGDDNGDGPGPDDDGPDGPGPDDDGPDGPGPDDDGPDGPGPDDDGPDGPDDDGPDGPDDDGPDGPDDDGPDGPDDDGPDGPDDGGDVDEEE